MNAKEYNIIVELHADGLYRFILKNMKDESSAQDVVQDSFEKLWINRDKVAPEKAKSWIFSTAYHTMIDHLRRAQRLTLLEEHHENAFYYSEEEYQGTAELLEMGLSKLPDAQRSVVLLRDYEGYSYQEIAGITGLNEAQVKVYIHRARQFLKTFVEKMESYRYVNS